MLCFYVIVCLIYNSGKLNLQNAEGYKYLSQSNCYSITGINDAEEFRTVMVNYLCRLKIICLHRLFNNFLLLLHTKMNILLPTSRKLLMLSTLVKKTRRMYLQCLLRYYGLEIYLFTVIIRCRSISLSFVLSKNKKIE